MVDLDSARCGLACRRPCSPSSAVAPDPFVASGSGRRLVPDVARLPRRPGGGRPAFRDRRQLPRHRWPRRRRLRDRPTSRRQPRCQHGGRRQPSRARRGGERSDWLARHGYDDPTSRRIRRLAELESLGTKVRVVVADLADEGAVAVAVDEAERRIGRLDGAVHAAGELRDHPIALATPADIAAVVGAKARGALALSGELRPPRCRAARARLVDEHDADGRRPGRLRRCQRRARLARRPARTVAGRHDQLRRVGGHRDRRRPPPIAAVWASRPASPSIIPCCPRSPSSVTAPCASSARSTRGSTGSSTSTAAPAGVAVLPGHRPPRAVPRRTRRRRARPDSLLGPVTLLEPLVVPDGTTVTVRVDLRPARRPARRRDRERRRRRAVAHAQRGHRPRRARRRPARYSVRSTGQPAPSTVDPLERPRRQLELGPAMGCRGRGVAAWTTGSAAGSGWPTSSRAEHDAWFAHPGARRCGDRVRRRPRRARRDALYVPVGYDAVVRYGELPETPDRAGRARRRRSMPRCSGSTSSLADDDGRVALQIDGLIAAPARRAGDARSTAPTHEPDEHITISRPAARAGRRARHPAVEGVELLERCWRAAGRG